jgi:hypothetical protein
MPEEDLSTKIQIAQVAHLAEELAGKQGELSAGPGISISGGVVSVLADGETIGFDPDGKLASLQSAPEYSAGGGIAISDGEVSVKADGSTISTNASGELQCLVSGPTYSGGSGINIVDGGISLASNALQQVPQVIVSDATVLDATSIGGGSRGFKVSFASSSTNDKENFRVFRDNGTSSVAAYYACATSTTTRAPNYSGGKLIATNSSVVINANNASTGVRVSNTAIYLNVGGSSAYRAIYGSNAVYLYANNASSVALCVAGGSGYVGIRHSGDPSSGYYKAVHMGMSATSDDLGIVKPDNSTCFVTSGGILHVPGASPGAAMPVLTWHVYDGTGVVSVPEAGGGFLNEVLANGVLLEPGEDYAYDSGSQVVSLYAQISSGGKITTKVYPGEVAVQEEPVRGMRSVPVPDHEGFFISDPDIEDEGEEES